MDQKLRSQEFEKWLDEELPYLFPAIFVLSAMILFSFCASLVFVFFFDWWWKLLLISMAFALVASMFIRLLMPYLVSVWEKSRDER